MAPSRSNSFYLTVSHIQQRPLGPHWLISGPLTQDWPLIGAFFYQPISHIETQSALQEGILLRFLFKSQC